jgi:hypothetical protein
MGGMISRNEQRECEMKLTKEQQVLQSVIWQLERELERLPGKFFPGLGYGSVVCSAPSKGYPKEDEIYGGYFVGEGMSADVVNFICRAHNHLPAILAELKRLQDRFECFYRLALEEKDRQG